jgi:hypothetical protein
MQRSEGIANKCCAVVMRACIGEATKSFLPAVATDTAFAIDNHMCSYLVE